ncbi:MAG: polyhydroxyalkanoate synthesis repressor PhaR [Brachymonas sp.]|nr:polyhydroxyalkanoate synthesis repressor PhaR [Brachymonas sp.]
MNNPRSARSASARRATDAAGGQKSPRSAKAQAAAQAEAKATTEDASGVRVLKKYPNRRLYDSTSSSYITLAEVKALVMRAEPFVVRDAKTGEDLTRSILLQIILEEEAGGNPLFTEAVLCQLIRFYGHAMQGFFGAHLAAQIQGFADMQQKLMAGAPTLGMASWPQNLQEMMGRCASSVSSAQAWQQAQARMQEQMQRQFQAGLQGWMDAFQPQARAEASPQAPAKPSAKKR